MLSDVKEYIDKFSDKLEKGKLPKNQIKSDLYQSIHQRNNDDIMKSEILKELESETPNWLHIAKLAKQAYANSNQSNSIGLEKVRLIS